MLNDNAYHIAAQALNSLRQKKEQRALWLVEGGVLMTPNTDWDIDQMQAVGAVLVGVFDRHMPSADLAEAILAADDKGPDCQIISRIENAVDVNSKYG